MLAPMQSITSQGATGGNSAVAPQKAPSDFSDAIFAQRLRAVRTEAGLTQQQLADRMAATGHKIHRSTVGKIESGDRPVSVGEAVQFAGALNIPLLELVTIPQMETEQERAYRARLNAQMAVRSLQHQTADYDRLLQEATVVRDDAMERLIAAQRYLSELGGELPLDALPPRIEQPSIDEYLAAHSKPLIPGKDDR